MDDTLSHEQILPCGNELLSILNGTNISESEFSSILENKGIYTSSHKKEHTLPIFSSIIISPAEYDLLREKQKSREEKEKKRSSIIECEINGKTLSDILPKINLDEIMQTRYQNFSFDKSTVNYRFINNDKNHAILEYKINRKYGNKSWFEKEKLFTASVEIKLNGSGLELITIGTHTATETNKINNEIINFVIRDLKKQQYIKNDKIIEHITTNALNNDNELIMQFFLRVATVDINGFLKFDALKSLNIEIDETKSLPSEMEWMKSQIDELKLDGKKINEIDFVKDKKYYQYLKCWSMSSRYKFDDIKGKGECKIKFEFHRNSNNEFEINIETLVVDDKKLDKKLLERDILSMVDNFKLNEFKLMKTSLEV